MAHIVPALKTLLDKGDVVATCDLSTTHRRTVIRWQLRDGAEVSATIERFNRRAGAGLPFTREALGVAPAVAVAALKAPPTAAVPAAPTTAKPARKAKKSRIAPKANPPTAPSSDTQLGSDGKPMLRILFALDTSSSMLSRIDAARTQLYSLQQTLRQHVSTASTFTAYAFSDVVRVHSIGAGNPSFEYPRCYGNTALNDAIVKCIDDAKQTLTPTLIYIFTDGEENVSRWRTADVANIVAKLPANCTLVGIGPNPTYFKTTGFADGNILSWSGDTAALASTVTVAVNKGVVTLVEAVKQGKKKIDHFFIDCDAVSLANVAKKCVDVTMTMDRRVVQQGGVSVEEYVNKHHKLYTYVNGAFFYRLVTKETIKHDRHLVLSHRDDANKRLYGGPMVRQLLQLPTDRDVVVEPGSLGKWVVFVQSASPTRKTVKDTEFLWDKTATGNIKPTWSFDK